MGIFTALALFLNHFTNLWSAIIFAAHQKYIFVFLIVMDD